MKLIYLLLVPLFCTLNITAKERNQSKSVTTQADSISDDQVEYRFALGVQLGTDIGGAIPFPFSNVPDVFNPYPKLSPSIGAKLAFPVTKKWTLGAEVTYKKVAIDADARIDNQRFHDDKNNIISRFCGSAEMSMDFTMLEIPLYFKYTFKNQKDRILAGLYGAWIINAKFRNTVTKGYMMTDDKVYNGSIDPGNPLYINFSNLLDSWDMGLIAGYERQLFPRIELGLRFSCGFKDIFKPSNQYFDYKMLHMRGSLVLSYNLFDIKPPKLNPFR